MDTKEKKRLKPGVFTILFLIVTTLAGCSFLFESSTPYEYYYVRSGDTLGSIGATFGVSVKELTKINRLRNPNKIHDGQRLKIPYLDVSARSAHKSLLRSTPDLGLGEGRYSTAQLDIGQAKIWQGKLQNPAPGARLTSRFGKRWRKFHEGIDLAAPTGTPIFAAHRGIVIYSGNRFRGYGNVIAIQGQHGLVSVYSHNHKNIVSRGQRVEAGHLIGYIGKTGNATGPHLHFETRFNRPGHGLVAVDPMFFLK